MLVDTHCHLDFNNFAADRSEILSRAERVGVKQIISIGIDISTSERAVALAEANEGVFATVGIHPHSACHLSSPDIQQLLSLARNSQVVAYGEVGLDFYRNYLDTSEEGYSSALRNAKLKMITEENYAHPYYWSPFILIGK